LANLFQVPHRSPDGPLAENHLPSEITLAITELVGRLLTAFVNRQPMSQDELFQSPQHRHLAALLETIFEEFVFLNARVERLEQAKRNRGRGKDEFTQVLEWVDAALRKRGYDEAEINAIRADVHALAGRSDAAARAAISRSRKRKIGADDHK